MHVLTYIHTHSYTLVGYYKALKVAALPEGKCPRFSRNMKLASPEVCPGSAKRKLLSLSIVEKPTVQHLVTLQ
jgi:hypothetical protein